jgi:hypothetical protein
MATTEKLYIESATTLEAKLERYTQIIDALELQMLNASAGNSDIQEYSLNDGQVQIRTAYRDPLAIGKAIDIFIRLRQKTMNELNGRGFVLRDWEGGR